MLGLGRCTVSGCSLAETSRKRLVRLRALEVWFSESFVSSVKWTLTWQSEQSPERDSDSGDATLKQRGIIILVMFFSYKGFSNSHHGPVSAPVLLPLLPRPPEPIWGRKLITKCDSFSSERDRGWLSVLRNCLPAYPLSEDQGQWWEENARVCSFHRWEAWLRLQL